MKHDDPDHRGGSLFANRRAALAACALLRPMLEGSLQDAAIAPSGCLHAVIMDPALSPRDCCFEAAILHELSLPDRSRWDADYAAYARAKARVSWETGVDGSLLHTCEPYRLRLGDTNLRGAVIDHGLIVAVSGALPWFDEALAGCIAYCLRGFALQQAHDTPGVLSLMVDPA